jgi:hypothetical protein
VTPEDRQLITGLFDRMRNFGVPAKDRDAEALIAQLVRALPDAPYMLVQSVLVQENALQQAGTRIQELEENLKALEREQQSRGSSSGSFLGSGGFLGGLFGGGARPPSGRAESSVPQAGTRAAPPAYSDQPPRPQGWGAMPQSGPPPPAAGGFLHSAMSTAAGVAGGVLAANAIRDLLGGGGAHAFPAHAAGTEASRDALARQDAESDARQDAQDDALARQDREDDAQQDAQDDTQAYQDAQDDAEADAEDYGSGDDTGDMDSDY